MKARAYLVRPETGRYEERMLEGKDDDALEAAIADLLGSDHVVPLTLPLAEADRPRGDVDLVAWTDVQAIGKPHAGCWSFAGSQLSVPGPFVATGTDGVGHIVDVPMEDAGIDRHIETYAARVDFDRRRGPEPRFEYEVRAVLERTRNG